MRTTTLLLAVAAVFTASMVGCDAGDGSSLNDRRAPRRTQLADDDYEDEEHDEDDLDGVDAKDKGNPNADRLPTAPTSAGTSAPEFSVTLDNATPTVGLGQTTEITATVEPKGGFSGPVQLVVTGLPEGATATPVTTNVSGGAATAKIAITTELTAPVTAPGTSVPLVVKATSGGAEATANANFAIAPKVTVTIPLNVDALRGASQLRAEYGGPVFAGQGAFKTQQGNGIVVSIFNADSKNHVIHGPGGAFPHGNQAQPIQPNSFEMQGSAVRTRTLAPGQNITAYLHDGQQGQGASFRIRVETAN